MIATEEPPVKVIRESGIPEAVPLQEIHIEALPAKEEPEIPEEAQHEEPALDTEMPAEEALKAAEEDVATEPEKEPVIEADPEKEPVIEADPEAEPEHEALAEEASKSEQISEMAKARAQYFGEELIRDNESIRKKLTSEEPEKENDKDEYKEDYIETPAAEAPEAVTAPEIPEAAAPEAAESREAEAADAAEPEEDREDSENTVPPADNLITSIGEEGDKKEPEQHRRSAGQIVLAIIAVILAIEIAILGIRYFAPESSAAKAIGDVQVGIFNTVSGWFDGEDSQKPENADEQEALPEDSEKTDPDAVQQEGSTTDDQKAPVADPKPMADKNALVASQTGNNKNIGQVKANEALAWQQDKNYGSSDINNSKPITNNIWQAPETGDPIYYDKSVVGTVIAFDSQWIDYVNNSDKSVLSLMKKDSEAYRKSVNYTKVGKIKETFKLLEIGEIRQGANGFYIWVHEEIGATENGKTSDMKYNWIYYLEPVDGQMKIVNYYHF